MQTRTEKFKNKAILASAFQDHLISSLNLGKSTTSISQNTFAMKQLRKHKPKRIISYINDNVEDKVLNDALPNSQTLAEKLGIINKPNKLDEETWIEKKNKSSNVDICAICQETFKMERQILLSCSHIYHQHCLLTYETWTKCNKRRCPMCRSENYEKRLVSIGRVEYTKLCVVKIQSWWRMIVLKSKYDVYKATHEPKNPALLSKYHHDKLDCFTKKFDEKLTLQTNRIDNFIKDLDKKVADIKNSITHGIAQVNMIQNERNNDISIDDWEDIWATAYNRCQDHCPICLGELVFQDEPILEKKPIEKKPVMRFGNAPIRKVTSSKKQVKFKPRKRVVVLSCSHLFHSQCLGNFERLDLNLLFHVCPVCRSPGYQTMELDDLLD